MIGGNDDGVLLSHDSLAPNGGFDTLPVGMVPGRSDLGHVGIVIGDFRAEGGEAVHEFEGGRLAHVIDVRLVGEAEEQDATAFDGFAPVVEGDHGALDDVFGHRAVEPGRRVR